MKPLTMWAIQVGGRLDGSSDGLPFLYMTRTEAKLEADVYAKNARPVKVEIRVIEGGEK